MKKISLALGFLLLISCTYFKKTQPADPVEVLNSDTIRVYKDALENMKTAKSQNSPFPDLLSLMGKISVTEDRTTIIPARVSGRIEAIYFASGEQVSKGQILMTLFSPDFVSAKEEFLQAIKPQMNGTSKDRSEGSYTADPSDFANLAQMSRKKLANMGLSSEDIDAIAATGVNETAKPLLNIRAPRSGVLIQKSAALGNLVNVGDTLFIIGDLSKVWFSGDIYPEDLPKIRKNQDVFINAVGVDKPLYGKVSFISPLVDPNTRSIKIRALMDNPKLALKSDEYVQGNVVIENKTALVVPTSGIVRTADGNVVFKRISVGTVENSMASIDFKRVAVTVGKEQGGLSAIENGLSDGDEIVTDGAWLLDAALNSVKGSSTGNGGK
jgi:Cu(I)/Ag(I) efflux system membrane fusion protein